MGGFVFDFERVSGEIAKMYITRRYYEYIYGEYRSNPELQSLYQKYPRTSSMFRSVDRVKLIMSILKCDPNENGADSASVSEVF